MSLILPSSYETVNPVDRGELGDIAGQVQGGDPHFGWRGDAGFDVYRQGSVLRVVGFDIKGDRYVAAEVSLSEDDWRKSLLTKLRDGDWQNTDAYEKVFLDRALAREAEQEYASNQKVGEIAEDLAARIALENGVKRYY